MIWNQAKQKLSKRKGDAAPTRTYANVQVGPLELGADDARYRLKVDAALVHQGDLVVAGWCTGEQPLMLVMDGVPSDLQPVRFARTDVNAHFGHPLDATTGFVFRLPAADGPVALCGAPDDDTLFWPLDVQPMDVLVADAISALGPLAAELLGAPNGHPAMSPSGMPGAPITPSDRMLAYIESAQYYPGLDRMLVVGWAIPHPDAHLWWDDGGTFLAPFVPQEWRVRDDVDALFAPRFGARARRSGFLAMLPITRNPGTLRLMAHDADGLHCLAECTVHASTPEPLALARHLFGIASTRGEQQARFDAIERPLLERAIAHHQSRWADLPVQVHTLGTPAEAPKTSVIVPLHGRMDFVEHQMIEWARDPAFKAEAELVYVIDDPTLVEPFAQHAVELHRLYRVPFRWVWGGVNRGFSGANNLGAKAARGATLLFLNSDAFPQGPGWIARMRKPLDTNPRVGAVGVQLVFADGGLQHAGMAFEWRDEFGVWLNQHPWIGLPPELDPATVLTDVPAVTGACVMVRRTDFDAIGGWNTGYLIGDFEDSDLCLALRKRGLSSVYLPDVQLVHLERQSMNALGSGEFRQRVTLWNARRHQARWQDQLAALGKREQEAA